MDMSNEVFTETNYFLFQKYGSYWSNPTFEKTSLRRTTIASRASLSFSNLIYIYFWARRASVVAPRIDVWCPLIQNLTPNVLRKLRYFSTLMCFLKTCFPLYLCILLIHVYISLFHILYKYKFQMQRFKNIYIHWWQIANY